MTARLSVVVGVVLACALALTGCGGSGAPAPADTGDNGAATSGPADEPVVGSGESVIPETFPKADVPLIEGDVAYSQDLGTGWVVYIARDDFLGGYDEAEALLTDAGFTGETAGQDDTGAFGQFTSDAYTVNVSARDWADLGVGPSVAYTVVKNG